MLFSLLFALIGGAATFFALVGRGDGGGKATEQALVPTRSMEIGQALQASDFTLEKFAKGAVPLDALRNQQDVQGKYANAPLVKSEPVRRSYLTDTPPGSLLAAVIPEGRVAVSVAVSDVISTGGFIAPGDRVDVLGVITKEARDDATVVLNDIPVLAVANTITGAATRAAGAEPAKTANASNSNPKGLDTTITLAVTLQEAQRLVQVDETGKLRLALRRRGDVASAQAAR
jgi:pilus assembly protein CpaB